MWRFGNFTFRWIPQHIHPAAANRQTSLTHHWDLQAANKHKHRRNSTAGMTNYHSRNHVRNEWHHQRMTNDHLFRSFWMYWTNKSLYKRSCLPFDHHKAGSRMIQTALSLCAHPAWVPFSSPWTAHSKHHNITFVLNLPKTIQISNHKGESTIVQNHRHMYMQ